LSLPFHDFAGNVSHLEKTCIWMLDDSHLLQTIQILDQVRSIETPAQSFRSIESFLDMSLNAARALSQGEPSNYSLFMERLLELQLAHAERRAAYEEELQRQLRLRRLALRNLQRRRAYYKTTGIRLKVGKMRLWSVAV